MRLEWSHRQAICTESRIMSESSRIFVSAPRLTSAILALAIASISAQLYAGESLVLTPGMPPVQLADPPYPPNKSWRVEFQLHDWVLPGAGSPPLLIQLSGLGFAAYLRSDGLLDLESLGDTDVEQAPCFVNTTGLRDVLVRFQRNVPSMLDTCELWSYDSTGYNTATIHLKTLGNVPNSGGGLGGNVTASLGFLHVFTTLVPLGSRPPITADVGDWADWTFDRNLRDPNRQGHNGTGSGRYAPTPDQVPVALPKTLGAPFWTNSVSLRAGFPAQLDGSASYTLADGSGAVTCSWTQLNGPTTVVWQNSNLPAPAVSGLVFGTYVFQLQVTDSSGNVASSPLSVGAVATDSNGVVVQANPAADAIFGPMIAFGKNPWGWADERNQKMENLQKNTYANPPVWASPAESATVDYTYLGSSPPKATIAGDLSATALTIPVANTSGLDLTELPTEILVGNLASWEAIRICSVSGVNLNVCYDGRGFHYGLDNSYLRPASAWPSGAGVWQAKVTGTSTHFLTTICPNGAGWQTATKYPVISQGTVSPTPGSTMVTGKGTAWGATQNSLAIAIAATHGGTPFTFFSYVVSAQGASLTLARPFPADADAGDYSYRIFSDQRRVVLHYTRSDSSDGSVNFPTAGCESDTSLYLYMGWDTAYANKRNPASPYSYIDGLGYAGDYSPNYYDMGLAHYAFYLRSGQTQSLTAARNIEDYWLRYPEIAQGDTGGSPRDKSILGVVAAAVLDGDRASNWSGLRTFAQQGLRVAQQNYCDDDLRETAYELSWLALAAQYDPDPAQRAQWQSALSGASYARDNGCRRPDNSFASGFYWNPGPLQIAATTGSQTAVAVNGAFPSNMCYSTASGKAVAANGSAMLMAVTGSFLAPAGSYKLLVGGTLNGARYDLVTQFDFNSPTSLTMAALWPGDSGEVYWSIENNDNLNYLLTIAQGPGDTANFGQIISCTLIDSTHIRLYRPWPSASGNFAYFYYNLVGRGTQTFMAGIKTLQMRYASQVFSPYQALDVALANWIGTVGFDATGTKGIYYGRVFPQCEPAVSDSGIKDAAVRVAGCIENPNNPSGVSQARARNSEAQNAMTVMYLASPTAANKAIGDMFYGATYGAAGYTASGFWTDGQTASNLDDGSLAAYKWPGFFFGVGMAHQWPAARLGGVAPPQYRTVSVALSTPSGLSAQIVVTAPSGAISTVPCGTDSSCRITVDDRQGSHWYQIQYLSPAGSVVTTTAPALSALPGQ
jgi:K319L-like, PKD domain